MENEPRPKLSDPAEWAIIRAMYFDSDKTLSEQVDPIERLERSDAKSRNNNKSSR